MPIFKRNKKVDKVLIVEDDALLLRVLNEAFLDEGFNVATVENGLEVEDTVSKFSPDIILLDLILPGIDGFAVLKKLKSDEKSKKIPVIVLSNLDDPGDVKSTKALGVKDYFIKSNVKVEEIIDAVKKNIK